MRPFMFVIVSKPSEDNSEARDLRSAFVHIWVIDESLESAEMRARNYIKSYRWTPQETQHAFEIRSEQIPKLGEFESQLYRQANQYGIAAGFVAAPLREGKPNDPVQIRRLHRNDSE